MISRNVALLPLLLSFLAGCASHNNSQAAPRNDYFASLEHYQFALASSQLSQAAKKGDLKAKQYLKQYGTWLRAQVAIEQGSADAQASYARQLANPKGATMPNYPAAAHWAALAAKAGNAQGQYWLAHFYETGQGVVRDPDQAFYWYQQAAAQGLVLAQRHLGALLESGELLRPDLHLAAHWYRQAADQGDSQAQYQLGHFYQQGRGVAQDLSAAKYWYELAAKQGQPKAQYQLGLLLPASDPKARYWLQQAARQGNVQAIDRLSITAVQ
ncbi:tetratricopeptide repeat protein [Gallaecimonas pentaromativorans]|uniref:tetratricopeptide repeat protein n=1 Tax=Gallaecimonas pentaromativorans TaxID=584787 RepID=UPI003A94CCEB